MTPAEEEAFTSFVRARGDRLLRYARWLVADAGEAEDLMQTALVRLAGRWSAHLAAPEAYALVVLRNLAADRGRRQHLVPIPTEKGQHGPVAVGPDHADALAAQTQLDSVLAALPAQQRLTVVLRVIEGLSVAETAAALSCSEGAVKSNLARGLVNARAALRQLDILEGDNR